MKHLLFVDRKVTTWMRNIVEVEAETIEDAVEKFNDPATPDCTFLEETELIRLRYPVMPYEHFGRPTLEIYSKDLNEEIYNNIDGFKERKNETEIADLQTSVTT